MADSVTVAVRPGCDFCKENGEHTPAYADGKTTFGPWANMCIDHHTKHGVGLGTGRGQRYVVESEEREAGKRILFSEFEDDSEPISDAHRVTLAYLRRLIEKARHANGSIPLSDSEIAFRRTQMERAQLMVRLAKNDELQRQGRL